MIMEYNEQEFETRVSNSECIEELISIVESIPGVVGRGGEKFWPSEKIVRSIKYVRDMHSYPTLVTRTHGIRKRTMELLEFPCDIIDDICRPD